MDEYLPLGKLRIELLERLLEKYGGINERLIVAPKVGEDAAAIDFKDRYLVVKTDPITFVTEAIGWYVININANDLATMGARPKWFLVTILLPENKTTERMVEEIFASISKASESLGIVLAGGHTEVTYGIDRPIVIGQMLGEVEKDRLVCTSGAQVGDDILLTKGIAIEGTSIIAREKKEELACDYKEDFVQRCQDFIYSPGISVVKEAVMAREIADVHSMHDPTEGGLATGLYELAKAAEVGLCIDRESIPIYPETEALCNKYGLNPLGLIASGALIITLPAKETDRVRGALRKVGIPSVKIGEVKEKIFGLKIMAKGQMEDLPYFERDEVVKLFQKSL